MMSIVDWCFRTHPISSGLMFFYFFRNIQDLGTGVQPTPSWICYNVLFPLHLELILFKMLSIVDWCFKTQHFIWFDVLFFLRIYAGSTCRFNQHLVSCRFTMFYYLYILYYARCCRLWTGVPDTPDFIWFDVLFFFEIKQDLGTGVQPTPSGVRLQCSIFLHLWKMVSIGDWCSKTHRISSGLMFFF